RLEKASKSSWKILAKLGGKCNLFDRHGAPAGVGSGPTRNLQDPSCRTVGGIALNIPSIDFDLGEDIGMLRDTVRAFVEAEVAPRAAEVEKANLFPADLWKRFGDLGLLGMTAPEQYGGSNMGYLAHIVAMEEISGGSAAVGLSYGAHSNLCV